MSLHFSGNTDQSSTGGKTVTSTPVACSLLMFGPPVASAAPELPLSVGTYQSASPDSFTSGCGGCLSGRFEAILTRGFGAGGCFIGGLSDELRGCCLDVGLGEFDLGVR